MARTEEVESTVETAAESVGGTPVENEATEAAETEDFQVANAEEEAHEEQPDSEERIRGGGKVKGERGRSSRRHQPYQNNNAGGSSENRDNRNCRVYVGNVSWNVSWQQLKDHMKTTGHEVKSANILTTPDGRSKGCGVVEFATPEGAQQAVLTLNDTELNGRQIFVREDREDKDSGLAFSAGQQGHRFTPQTQNRRVYVGNVNFSVSWQDLKDHMRQAGEVLHAEIIHEPGGGRSKGCGIVEYATAEAAQQAISTLTDTDLKGRMIFVREDRETSSGSAGSFQGSHADNCSVYVWNLSFDTSWQNLKDHMRKAGNVDHATILTNQQGASKGCGVVVYQRPQEAARAIRELQNSELDGRQIYVREDRDQGSGGRGGGRRGHHGGRGRGGGGRGNGSHRFVIGSHGEVEK